MIFKSYKCRPYTIFIKNQKKEFSYDIIEKHMTLASILYIIFLLYITLFCVVYHTNLRLFLHVIIFIIFPVAY